MVLHMYTSFIDIMFPFEGQGRESIVSLTLELGNE